MRARLAGWTAAGFLSCAATVALVLPLVTPGMPAPQAGLPAADLGALEAPTASLVALARAQIHASTQAATTASQCALGAEGLERARQLHYYQRLDETDALLATLLDQECLEEVSERDLARFHHAYLLSLQERHEDALQRLDAIEGEIPVEDYANWIRGNSLAAIDRHDDAAEAFAAIYDQETSPLHWRAHARRARALVQAERWEEALPLLQENARTFPDYPRRHRVLHEIGITLEALERPGEAAAAHQLAHFEFPYKREGQASLDRLRQLSADGHEPPPISPQRRFDKYRQLSVDKFWPLAHDLLTELRDDVATPEGNSELENRILQQLAMNAYNSHDFELASDYFEQAREIFEAGHRRGFGERTLYRFHSFALARQGRHDEAIAALEYFHRNSPRRTRLQEIAYHHERHGEYEQAFQLYDSYFTAAQKRGWHYSYLLYKTGRFEDAYNNLRALASRSRGETRAKYLYWAARSLERAGNHDEAYDLFRELQTTNRNSYYGIQASNRILDLHQRLSMDGLQLVETDLLTDDALRAFEPTAALSESPPSDGDPRAQPVQPVDETSVPTLASLTVEDLQRFCEGDDACVQRWRFIAEPEEGFAQAVLRPFSDQALRFAYPAYQDDHDDVPVAGLDRPDGPQARIPRAGVHFPENNVPPINYTTDARIYWDGRRNSDLAFVNFERGEMIGPVPRRWTAYDDETHIGGLQEAVDLAGDLFPSLERSQWLYMANWNTEARRVIRDVSLEFRALSSRSRAARSPHELPHRRWAYFIDNRRRAQRAELWGMSSDERRFPVPEDRAGREALLARQQQIFDHRREIEPILVHALQEVGDYHLVRRHALGNTWWLRQGPTGDARRFWAMAYPRAFPEKVIPLAQEHNINPYMIWALMLVESSFNPDSLSIANAKGLLQVIPRTGLKIAALFGSEDFGPFDLLEEDHSIEQGIFYFSRLVQKFHGQELLAFAGYNGGPHRVGGWLDNRGHQIPLDEFIEEIPFNESREYAKKVLRFLHIYLRIYEGFDDGIYVGQNVRRDYLEQPDF